MKVTRAGGGTVAWMGLKGKLMDTDKLRELQIATKRAKYEWQNKVASGKPAGMAAENYQMHLMRAKGEMSPEEYKTFLGRLN